MKSDTLLNLYAESVRLSGEIVKAKRRIAHRTHLFKTEGVPTSQDKRFQMEYRCRQLEMEYAAIQRGIILEKERNNRPKSDWNHSDRMLAHLMKCCEDEGQHRLVLMARNLTNLDMNLKYPSKMKWPLKSSPP